MKYIIVFLALTGGHFVYSGYIYDKGIGTECLYDEDCITRNSFCKGNKVCACKIGYQYDAGSDVCFPKEVDLRCNEDYDCSALENAKCTFGRCQCKTDHVPSKNKDSCLPSMRLTSICQEDVQCHAVLNQSYCDPITRRCTCQRGLRHDVYRMQCVEQARLHEICKTDDDCEYLAANKGRVECKQSNSALYKTCECKEGFEDKGDGICRDSGSSQAVLSLLTIIPLLLVCSKWVM